nr:MAG TPA: Cytochrome c oxidase assembly factor [Caudoviricetes sp.]
MMGINERRIIQEVKAIANLEHRCNPCNSSWVLYWKEKNNEQPGIR